MKRPTRAAAAIPSNGWQQWLLLATFVALIGLVTLGPALSGSDSPLSGEGSPVRQGGYVIVTLMALVATRFWTQPRAVLSVPLPIVLALVICLISLSWAINPSVASRRLLLTAAIAWTLCTLVNQLGYRGTINLMRITFITLLAVNYVAVFLFPEFAIHQANVRYEIGLAGDWRGIMLHKNFAGAACAVTVLIFLYDAKQFPRFLRAGAIISALIFLYFSQSKTSVGMLVGTATIGALFGATKFRYRGFVIGGIIVAFMALMIYLNVYRYVLFQLATDPKTLTGRATIWTELINYLSDHFWFGSGYGSFWNIGPTSPIFQYSSDWVRDLTAGHNGYLDLACQIGVPLAITVIGLMIVWPSVRLLVSARSANSSGALLLALLTFSAGHNMTETSIMERDMMVEVILVLTIAMIWKLTSPPTQSGPIFGFGNTASDDAPSRGILGRSTS